MFKYYRHATTWVIAADGSNGATVLIPCDDPTVAYAAYYSVITHLTEQRKAWN